MKHGRNKALFPTCPLPTCPHHFACNVVVTPGQSGYSFPVVALVLLVVITTIGVRLQNSTSV